MPVARKIIHAHQLKGLIELPENLRDSDVEVIVLPVKKQRAAQNPDNQDFIGHLLANPLQLKDFEPFSRDEIYADR